MTLSCFLRRYLLVTKLTFVLILPSAYRARKIGAIILALESEGCFLGLFQERHKTQAYINETMGVEEAVAAPASFLGLSATHHDPIKLDAAVDKVRNNGTLAEYVAIWDDHTEALQEAQRFLSMRTDFVKGINE